jgi:hypothetical protein
MDDAGQTAGPGRAGAAPLLDVRDEPSFAAGHAAGAAHIALEELAARAHELPLKAAHTVEDGELAAAFGGFEVVLSRDGVPREGRRFSQLLARRGAPEFRGGGGAAAPPGPPAKRTPGVVSAQHPSGPSGKRHRESFSQPSPTSLRACREVLAHPPGGGRRIGLANARLRPYKRPAMAHGRPFERRGPAEPRTKSAAPRPRDRCPGIGV